MNLDYTIYIWTNRPFKDMTIPPRCPDVQCTGFDIIKAGRNLFCLVELERFEGALACNFSRCSQLNLQAFIILIISFFYIKLNSISSKKLILNGKTCWVSSRWSVQSCIMNWIQEAAIMLNCFPVSVKFLRAISFVATTVGSGFFSYIHVWIQLK